MQRFFRFPAAGNETPAERPTRPPRASTNEEKPMIDPPTATTGSAVRKVELDQTVDFAVQILVEEAHTLGWQRVEFLTAVVDAANASLSALEEQRALDVGEIQEPANDWPAATAHQS
ncbi:MAG: hypothetical protein QE284_01780 [Rhizobium sp.]|nr:hypothetical protein [Rhizobium sp.]